jgi:hypothetical protein
VASPVTPTRPASIAALREREEDAPYAPPVMDVFLLVFLLVVLATLALGGFLILRDTGLF